MIEGLGISRFKISLKTPKGLKSYLIIAAGHQFECIYEILDNGRKFQSLENDSWYEMEEVAEDSFRLIGHNLYRNEQARQSNFAERPLFTLNTRPFQNLPSFEPSAQISVQYDMEPLNTIVFRNGICEGFVAKGSLDIAYKEKPYLVGERKHVKRYFPVKEEVEYLPNNQGMIATMISELPEEFREIGGLTFAVRQQTFFDYRGVKKWRRDFDANGKLLTQTDFDMLEETTTFDQQKLPILRTRMNQQDQKVSRALIDKNGEEFFSFAQEKKKKPDLSFDGYLSKLAQILDSPENCPEKWHLFIKNFFEYTPDTPDETRPLQEGESESAEDYLKNPVAMAIRNRIDRVGEYFQSPRETLSRLNPLNGKMKGDCEDYAFLVQAILKKKGIKSHVIYITDHAFCAYVKKRQDGRYDAFCIDTGGIAKNGQYLNPNKERSTFENENGFSTPEEAMNSLYAMFGENNPDLVIHNGQIAAIHLDAKGFWYPHDFKEIINE